MKKIYLYLLVLPFVVSCNNNEASSKSIGISTEGSLSSTSAEESRPGEEFFNNIDTKRDEKVTHSVTSYTLKSYYYTLCDKTTSYDLEISEETSTTKYDNQVLCCNQLINRKEANKTGEYESSHEYEVMQWVNDNHELYSSTVTVVDGEVQKTEVSRALTSDQLSTAEANGSGFDDITSIGLNRDAKSYYDSLKYEETFSMNFSENSGELNLSIYQELIFTNDAAISTEYGDDATVYVYSNYHAIYDKETSSFVSSEYTVKKDIKINPVTGEELDKTFTYYYEETKVHDISFASQGQYSGELQEENS